MSLNQVKLRLQKPVKIWDQRKFIVKSGDEKAFVKLILLDLPTFDKRAKPDLTAKPDLKSLFPGPLEMFVLTFQLSGDFF